MKNWKKSLKDNFCLVLLIGIVLFFFYPVILQRKIPIPADTIVGMYHPWRDVIWDNFTAGIPYKNFLITDPVRQQYVWRNLAIKELKNGELPLWNPYSFAGTPLLANFQSAPFYPLNILFFIIPFNFAWTILVIVQPLLAGIFLYFYLRHMRVSTLGSFLGGFTFAFSGFSIVWLEWNTILATALWLPLILLSGDKVILHLQDISKIKNQKSKIHIKYKILTTWSLVFIFSLVSSFFAGHLQIFFYSLLISISYILVKIFTLTQYRLKTFLWFVFCSLLFVVITSIQWIPTFQFILQSARDFDQGSWTKEGWFIPWQNLIQFIAPDFFGNPATGNYWGIWNYGEFIGYLGIAPLVLALYALLFRRDKKTLFFASFAILSLIFALPTPLAKLPYQLNLPFISTSQPTRLLFITDFSLSLLAAFGLDYFLKQKSSMVQIIKLLAGVGIMYAILWLFVLSPGHFGISVLGENILIAKRNLVLPTVTMFLIAGLFIGYSSLRKRESFTTLLYSIVVIITVAELFRFGWKFIPFSKTEWIFPRTEILDILIHDKSYYRVMALDRRILPPNFATAYKISDVAGYDPLYLKEYGQLVASWERNKPDITPASFNRILTPSKYENFITDLLGVRYVLSFGPLKSNKFLLESIHEGETYLYLNPNVFPRVFLVEEVMKVADHKESLEKMYDLKASLRNTAVVTDNINLDKKSLGSYESVEITSYSSNKIELRSYTSAPRLLVLTDMYYPSWKAYISGEETKIYRVDFALRGIVVPAGSHKIEFKNNLL